MMGAMDPEIRAVRPTEFERVGELVVDAYAAMTDLGDYADVLRRVEDRSRSAEVVVALVDGSVAGTVTFVPGLGPYAEGDDPDAAWIRMLAVAPEYRGRGIGAALVDWCVRRARASGRRRLLLHTTDVMADAHRLYARLGFSRAPGQDWQPDEDLWLRGYSMELDGSS
jgi:GNAT superfamily N-acetyltransferase